MRITIITQLLLGSILFGFFSYTYAYGTLPIFHVDAQGKTGVEIGSVLGKAFKEKFPEIEKKYDSYLASFVSQEVFNSWVQKRVNVVKPNIDKAYQDEVNTIISTWNFASQDQLGDGYLSLNEFWVIQLIPDVGRITNCSGFGVFGNFSALKAPIVGRNMDWHTTEALRSLQAITVYEYENRYVVNIGFAGYVGTISGFNSDGLFVAHLDSPLGKSYPEPPIGDHAIVFDLRAVLEKHHSIDWAARDLSKPQYGFSHNILMADTEDVQVMEQPQGQVAQMRTAQSTLRSDMSWEKRNQIAVVNCNVLKSSPLNCIKSVDRFRWHRFKTLAQFSGTDRAEVADIMKIMFDRANHYQEIFNDKTVQSMVFLPKEKKLYLYTVPVSGIHDEHPVMNDMTHLLPRLPDQKEMGASDMLMYIIGLLVLGGIFISFVNTFSDSSNRR